LVKEFSKLTNKGISVEYMSGKNIFFPYFFSEIIHPGGANYFANPFFYLIFFQEVKKKLSKMF